MVGEPAGSASCEVTKWPDGVSIECRRGSDGGNDSYDLEFTIQMISQDVMELLDVRQRPLTVNEYQAMGEAGILQGDDRTELIDGRIITMPTIGWPHARTVTALTNLLAGRGPFDVSVQNPLRLTNFTEPLPDLVLLRPERVQWGPYTAKDALLVIEVSDSSLHYDRTVMLPRYAQAGVPEMWIVDLAAHRIETFRVPSDDSYLEHALFVKGDRIAIPGGERIVVDQVMPSK